MKHIFTVCVILFFGFSSCKKNDTPEYNSNILAPLSVEFDNIAGTADLELNTGTYTNVSGENFTVSQLKYYVSNFRLIKSDGSVYVVPQDSCYFLIDEADESTHEPLLNVPEGEYKAVSFTLGVDSLRSTLDAAHRPGVLNTSTTAAAMYWDFNRGYVFFNMEGSSTAAASGNYLYRIGGYGGASSSTINNLKTITLDLTSRGTPKVKAGKETNIHLMVDVLKFFSGTTNFRIAEHPEVMFDPFSTTIANNYANMIRHDHTEN